MSEETSHTTPDTTPERKTPGLFRNYVSLFGAAIVAASLASIVLLFLIELSVGTENPYLGIFTYVILPGFLIFGIVTILAGMFFERRRRRRLAPGEIPAYPSLDLNDPRRRRTFFALLGVAFVFVFMSAFGSYRAYEYSESVAFCGQTCHTVMKPEFVAYQASPHARVRCVECHVGGGAEWYVRSKLTGAYQLYSVAFNRYPRPIKTPVHNLRPADETCAQCHRPAHVYLPPDKAVDDALAAGRMDATLPYIKQQTVALLSQHYDTTDQALAAIGSGLDNFYRTNYADLYAQRNDAIKTAVAETQ